MQQATNDKETRGIENNKGYRRLIVWKKADELAYQVYRVTNEFPNHERYGLISQMRRAALSVPANIVEGYAHSSRLERRQFYYIARSSLTELEYYIDFAHRRLSYLEASQFENLELLRGEVGSLLNGFIRSVSERG